VAARFLLDYVLTDVVEGRILRGSVPNTRSYTYVPLGTRVINGVVLAPALHVTEAFDSDAANELARRHAEGSGKTWHHGNRAIFRLGLTYLMTWADGALMIRGQVVDMDQTGGVSRLVHTLRPPRPGR
jgi:hypothetical protein